MQILDDGRITDAHGKTVNFENTVLVMTTNAGSDRAGATVGFLDAEKDATENPRTEKALSTFLRPEFLNRVDEIITFRSLDEADFSRIAGIMMNELKTALAERGITLSFTKDALSLIATRSYSHKFGARNMRLYIQFHVEDALAEKIIADYQKSITHASVSVRDGELHIAAL